MGGMASPDKLATKLGPYLTPGETIRHGYRCNGTPRQSSVAGRSMAGAAYVTNRRVIFYARLPLGAGEVLDAIDLGQITGVSMAPGSGGSSSLRIETPGGALVLNAIRAGDARDMIGAVNAAMHPQYPPPVG